MKRLAKVFRRWADKLDPQQVVTEDRSNLTLVYSPFKVLKLKKWKSEIKLQNPGDDREREAAVDWLKESLIADASEAVQIEMYNGHVRGNFYFYE